MFKLNSLITAAVVMALACQSIVACPYCNKHNKHTTHIQNKQFESKEKQANIKPMTEPSAHQEGIEDADITPELTEEDIFIDIN